jgi:glutamate 5-kinase
MLIYTKQKQILTDMVARPTQYLRGAKKILVKVGTSNLTDDQSRLDPRKVEKLVDEVVELLQDGRDVVLVTSGAIGAGVGQLKLQNRPADMPYQQAAAAVGQSILMSTYGFHFARHDRTIAQVLLTREDFTDPRRFQNVKNTLSALKEWNVLPIVNENDTVAVEEIRFGDNDNLAALVGVGIGVDLIVFLSDVDGLYTQDPNKSITAQLLKTVTEVNSDIEKLAGKASRGFGGMVTKIQAARKALEAGIPLVIVNGTEQGVLKRVLSGEEIGTMFVPKELRR